MASLTKSHPSPSVDLTLLEICLPFRPFFIAGNPSVLPPDLHCRKSICPSAHSSLPEICLPFRPIFIAGNLSSLPPDLHCRKSVCSSAHSSLLEICLFFRPFFITGNLSALPPILHCRKSVCSSARSSLPEIRPPFRPIFIAGNPFALPPILHYWKAPVADGDGADARQRVQLPFDLLHIVLAADATHGKAGACFRHCHHPSISMGEISTSLVQEATRGFITTMG